MRFYHSALVAIDGCIEFAYRKLNLPNYGAFEERQIFAGKNHTCSSLQGVYYRHADLQRFLVSRTAVSVGTQKADIDITLFYFSEASMGSEFSTMESWTINNKSNARVFGIHNICANRAGTENLVDRRGLDPVEIPKNDDVPYGDFSILGKKQPEGQSMALETPPDRPMEFLFIQ